MKPARLPSCPSSHLRAEAGTVPLTARNEAASDAWAVDTATTPRSLCLHAVANGAGNLVLSIGSATLSVPLPLTAVP